ncbi:MAG TPA: prohibitin family protein [Thermoanaerobaculia bacterium]|nr:prohibitin family protein [Thermoanaerobaculia bacterium]
MEEPTPRETRTQIWWRRNSLGVTLFILGFVVLVAFLANDIFIPIMPGEAGVQWSRFLGGTKTNKVYGEGIHVIFPWNHMYKYDVRFQQRSATFDVLSHDGLSIAVVITVRFKPVLGNLALLHKYIGPNYVDTLLMPEVGSLARERIAQRTPEGLYSETRFVIQREIRKRLANETRVQIGPRAAQLTDFLYIQDVFIQSVTLPEEVAKAIRDKLSQLQHLQEYEYIVQREKREAERKEIEARGIRAFQDIVNEGISDRYLRWKGIDATLKLAESPNSKVVVIGAGQGGLPIILGNMDGGPVQPAASLNRAEQLQRTAPTVPTGPRIPPSEKPPIR